MTNTENTNPSQPRKTKLELIVNEQCSCSPERKPIKIEDAMMEEIKNKSPDREIRLRIGKKHYDEILHSQDLIGEAFLNITEETHTRVILKKLRQDDTNGDVIVDCVEHQSPRSLCSTTTSVGAARIWQF